MEGEVNEFNTSNLFIFFFFKKREIICGGLYLSLHMLQGLLVYFGIL